MAEISGFWTQANALLRKDLTFQKRNMKTNVRLILSPMFFCGILYAIQNIDKLVELPQTKNPCDNKNGVCLFPQLEQLPTLQIPQPEFRAVRADSMPFTDLADASCKRSNKNGGSSCPVTMLFTGNNQSLGGILAKKMYSSSPSSPGSFDGHVLASLVGDDDSESEGPMNLLGDMNKTYYDIQPRCLTTGENSLLGEEMGMKCVEGLYLWRNSSSDVNKELFAGYRRGNKEGKINEMVAAYDFMDSRGGKFNLTVWYNSTRARYISDDPFSSDVTKLSWIPRSVNLASNAFLKYIMGPDTEMVFESIQEMPKPLPDMSSVLSSAKKIASSMMAPTFYTWVILQLFPIVLTQLVYEKQQRLRIMMKMHGLGDGPYWLITYGYFLCLSSAYMLCLVAFGSLLRLFAFSINDYTIQAIFYFVYINLQIAMAFLLAAFFSNAKTVAVLGYICVFGTGLLGFALFQPIIEDKEFPRVWVIVMELYPGFSLYRGLYEFHQYFYGMQWADLSDPENGMKEIIIIMCIEWFLAIFFAYYFDQVLSYGKTPLFLFKSSSMPFQKPSLKRDGSKPSISMEKPDVQQEREKVEQLLREPSLDYSIVCDDIKKIYPGKDGNPEKMAVRGLSLALHRGECFGMLGPNGAGKTSFISMMIGLTRPTAGTAYVEGFDIRTDMDCVHTTMGVCPQHDLLWETLTGREHLLFYGRLKNLTGSALTQAVEESLKRLNLFNSGVADKKAGKYSGGMKRRLSVAISLIGDPKVVYLDEPSTGLDPASRDHLWSVVKQAKQDRAIILTTHSMEEAEVLCDRLGIFVDGSLQCIGNPKELKARYGGSYVFTITTSSNHEEEVKRLVRRLSPGAKRVYQISGTQKFEIPKNEVRISDVFEAVENAKAKFTVYAWGLVDTTLEDVFIKVARTAQAFNTLS